jgi:hypothetical protein
MRIETSLTVEHDQIVPAEAHRDRFAAPGERGPVQIERVDQDRTLADAHAQSNDCAEESRVLDHAGQGVCAVSGRAEAQRLGA